MIKIIVVKTKRRERWVGFQVMSSQLSLGLWSNELILSWS